VCILLSIFTYSFNRVIYFFLGLYQCMTSRGYTATVKCFVISFPSTAKGSFLCSCRQNQHLPHANLPTKLAFCLRHFRLWPLPRNTLINTYDFQFPMKNLQQADVHDLIIRLSFDEIPHCSIER